MTLDTQHPAPAAEPAAGIRIRREDIGRVLTHDLTIITVLLVIGGLLRMWYLAHVPYIYNGGAMFHQMVEELIANRYSLPRFTFYNNEPIPFANAPFGLYITAFFSQRYPSRSILEWMQAIPYYASTLTVPAVYLLSRVMFRSKYRGMIAALAYALVPSMMIWTLGGEGITQTVGLLFALLALQQGYLLITRRNEWYFPGTISFLTLAMLTDGEMGYFAVYSLLIILLVFGRNRFSIVYFVLSLVAALAILSIWLLPAMYTHGVVPYFSAIRNVLFFEAPFSPIIGRAIPLTGESLIPIIAVLGVLGFFVAAAKREWTIPLWVLAIFILHTRAASVLVTIPFSMLAAVALTQLLLPLIVEASRPVGEVYNLPPSGIRRWLAQGRLHTHKIIAVGFQIVLLLYTLIGTLISAHYHPNAVYITPADLAAMDRIINPPEPEGEAETNDADVANNGIFGRLIGGLSRNQQEIINNNPQIIRPDAVFAVITGASSLQNDPVTTWLPVLSEGRASLITAQGSAWLGEFEATQTHYAMLQNCANQDLTCLRDLEAIMQGIDPASITTSPPAGGGSLAAITGANARSTATETVEVPRLFTHIYIGRNISPAIVQYMLNDSDNYERIYTQNGVQIFRRILQDTTSDLDE